MIQSFLKICGTVLMLAALALTTGCGGSEAVSSGAAGSGTGATGSAN